MAPSPGARLVISFINGCVVREGRLDCWGFGPGGVGRDSDARSQRIPGVEGAVAAGLGMSVACVLDRAGTVRCWGEPMFGEDDAAWAKPPGVPVIGDAVAMDMGLKHACVIDRERRVRCWGDNMDGASEGAGRHDPEDPRNVAPRLVEGVGRVRAVALGDDFTCALTEPGSVRCWGEWLKRNDADGSFAIADVEPLRGATAISAGRSHVCGILDGGRVVCRERNGTPEGQTTPLGPSAGDREVTGAVEIDAGYAHTCARLATGQVVCWGSWAEGARSRHEQRQPFDVPGLTGVEHIATGSGLSCALRKGEVSCWGEPPRSHFAPGSSQHPWRPRPVAAIDDAIDVASSRQLACALRRDGIVWCWGMRAPIETSTLDQRFVPMSTGIRATAIVGSSIFPDGGGSVGMLGDGGFWIMSQTGSAERGDARGDTRPVPGAWRSIALAAGWCALGERDGKVVCDGEPVALPFKAVEVDAYERDRCARSEDGRVACWGHLCTTAPQPPRLVKSLRGAKEIAIGSSGALVRTETDLVAIDFCKGDALVPIAVPKKLRALAAVGSRCVIADDGDVLCHEGTLAPLTSIGVGDAKKVVESAGVPCVLHGGGKITCLGNGAEGVLGNGRPSRGPWRVEGM